MLYLASQSPRRRQLLEQLGVAFQLVHVEVPEVRRPGERAGDYVDRVASEKALAGLAAVRDRHEWAIVLGADTEVVLSERVFGKPRDQDDARAMLRELSGHAHRVISTVWCVDAACRESATSVSEVRFAELSGTEIEEYVVTGEPFGKAGAYAIQGRAAAFIAHLSGSYSGVMGLPLHETARLLRAFGV
ncbi:MAG TPA: Maf family nucleotide pyrophosphatase [Rhodanobacteraceae bacterium]|nr:Maf family nucleotide pyrophosphatase [Rhodanobacteraceae bacterium]